MSTPQPNAPSPDGSNARSDGRGGTKSTGDVESALTPVRSADERSAPVAAKPGILVPATAMTQETVRVERPARALIGWMPEPQARLYQARLRQDVTPTPEQLAAITSARAAVAARPAFTDAAANVITDPPALLGQHIAALQQNAASIPYFTEGWTVAIVDLRGVCALQPSVFVDHVDDRVGGVDANDLLGLARLTLPIADGVNIPAQYDPVRNAWIVTASNPNLRIAGNGAIPVPGGVVLGFGVTMSPSYLQVAVLKGRYILRDGYHRAHGLLRRGISQVPAFVRELATVEQIGTLAGFLPQDAYLGPRPAMLRDYLDDSVATDVRLPATLKMLVISALELSPSA